MSTEPQVAKRFVPGAPPPAPLSKTQKKKRRTTKKDEQGDEPVFIANAHDSALVDKAPSETDIKHGDVADELVAHEEAPTKTVVPDESEVGGPKSSPVVEMLGKRVKALGKKIVRFASVTCPLCRCVNHNACNCRAEFTHILQNRHPNLMRTREKPSQLCPPLKPCLRSSKRQRRLLRYY